MECSIGIVVVSMVLLISETSLQDTAFRVACALPMAALQIVVVNVDVLVLRHLFHKALQELVLKLTPVKPKMNVLCSIPLKHT